MEMDVLNSSEKVNNGTAIFGINAITDLSPEEFRVQFLGSIPPTKAQRRLIKVAEVPRFHGTATSVDWTSTLTTPIKDQGGCGSCW